MSLAAQAQTVNEMEEVLAHLERGQTVFSNVTDKCVSLLQRCIIAVRNNMNGAYLIRMVHLFNATVFIALMLNILSLRKDVAKSNVLMGQILEDENNLAELDLMEQEDFIFDKIGGIFDGMMGILQVSMTMEHLRYTLRDKCLYASSANRVVIIFSAFVFVVSMWLGYQGCLAAAPDTTMLDMITVQPHVKFAMHNIVENMTLTFSSAIRNTISIQATNLFSFILGRGVQRGAQYMLGVEDAQAQALVADVSHMHDEARETFTTLMAQHALSLLKDVKLQTKHLSSWVQNKSYDLLDTACLKLEGVRTIKGRQKDALLREAMELMFQADSIVNGELEEEPTVPSLRMAVNQVWLGLKQCLLLVGNIHDYALLIK
jgi:hypothetical protein